MSDESRGSFADHEGQAELEARRAEARRRLLGAVPPKEPDATADADHGIAKAAADQAQKRSEARRDGILAVAEAIQRRGQNPVVDWTTKDVDTAYAIAEQLIALG